jgi:uncharacterized membrane protein YbhN (UPF0104 family)
LGVLKRRSATKWLRAGLLVAVLGFCSYGLLVEWPHVHPALSRLHWYSMAGGLAAAMVSSGCMMLGWRRLLAALGSELPIRVAARVTFIAQLGKYVPGAIWSVAAQVELGHDYDIPRRRGAASVVIWIGALIAVGLGVAAACMPLAPAVPRRYLLFLAAIPVIAICLAPPVLHRLLNWALRLIRQDELEEQLSWRGLGQALVWITIGWLLLGIQIWLLLADVVVNGGIRLFPIALGAYALAGALALLLVVFPNGIGAREVILVAALAPVLAHGPALAVALVARVLTTASDLAWGGIAVALGRYSRYRRAPGRHRRAAGHLAGTAPN